jgi:benzoyl-CoA reductase/2-hydroxyglutaryl-CoA dehydratase subunit BcrC/BadD/HgdB
MTSIAYCSPFVPAEWIAAHGLQPRWLSLPSVRRPSDVSGRRGLCPLTAAVVDAISTGPLAAAVVLTTTCDQMRYAGSLLEHRNEVPLFVMNVPSTWQTMAARTLFVQELERLGRFLIQHGGTAPSTEQLTHVMMQFDHTRADLLSVRNRLSAKEFATALVTVREEPVGPGFVSTEYRVPSMDIAGGPHVQVPSGAADRKLPVPLALVGGPVPEHDYEFFAWLEQAGGRIVLDATEWGERTLPRPFDPVRASNDPFAELVDAYLKVPDVFRRPNDRCYEYLARELVARHVRGLIVRRYLWCDLWHAEVARLKTWSRVPVLDLDVADSEDGAEGRSRGRLEAFLEMLR